LAPRARHRYGSGLTAVPPLPPAPLAQTAQRLQILLFPFSPATRVVVWSHDDLEAVLDRVVSQARLPVGNETVGGDTRRALPASPLPAQAHRPAAPRRRLHNREV
jgi:hypothetical protein